MTDREPDVGACERESLSLALATGTTHETRSASRGTLTSRAVPIPLRPNRLGQFEVIVKIAGGGMATIYLGRAHDPAISQRLVALKVIRHELRHDERFIHMFLDEGKLPHRKVGSRRRVLLCDVLAYKKRVADARAKVLEELAAQAQELNIGY